MFIHHPPPPPYVPLILVYYNTGFIGLIFMYEFQHHGKSRKNTCTLMIFYMEHVQCLEHGNVWNMKHVYCLYNFDKINTRHFVNIYGDFFFFFLWSRA